MIVVPVPPVTEPAQQVGVACSEGGFIPRRSDMEDACSYG
jgi:hypothetical protein